MPEGGEINQTGAGDGNEGGVVWSGGGQDGGVLGGEDKGAVAAGGESEVDRFGGASGDDEVGALGTNGVGDSVFGGLVGFADALGGEIGGGRIEKLLRKIGLHSFLSSGEDRSGGGMVQVNHVGYDLW